MKIVINDQVQDIDNIYPIIDFIDVNRLDKINNNINYIQKQNKKYQWTHTNKKR